MKGTHDMPRIDSKTHGLLDYVVGAAITALPHVLPCGKAATRILHMAGIGAGVYSAMTDYERGLVKVLPMKTHLGLDVMSGVALIGAAVHLDEESPQVRATLAGIGAMEVAIAAMTEADAYDDGASPSPAERIAQYVS
jgi:hypothetical protein